MPITPARYATACNISACHWAIRLLLRWLLRCGLEQWHTRALTLVHPTLERLLGRLYFPSNTGWLLIYGGQFASEPVSRTDSIANRNFYDGLQQCHVVASHPGPRAVASRDRDNPRWNAVSGQKTTVVTQNATLFDGEFTVPEPVDIVFGAGVIRSVIPTDSGNPIPEGAHVVNAHGKHITPGLVDLHSHHDLLPFPSVGTTSDVNERPLLGPITPFVRVIDGFTSSDPAIKFIASANIVGGQAYPVENLPLPGANSEPVIEELLLEHGIPESQRQRYLKTACGENPKRESWCASALKAKIAEAAYMGARLMSNMHCYTSEDLETMLSVLHMFGVHPSAFQHALKAWQVPELLKKLEPNVTIGTFADNALFKAEAYGASLQGPKILHEHGVRAALKSDHTGESNFDQASIAHSFGLPANAALQSVTSIPVTSMQQGHRIGYLRPGYDADLVIWDDHPLQVGATVVELSIDGQPAMHALIIADERKDVCPRIKGAIGPVVLTSINEVLMDIPVLSAIKHSCLGSREACLPHLQSTDNLTEIRLTNGYLTPSLIAFGNNLGIQDIPSEPSTGDGISTSAAKAGEEAHFAKYGIHLHGKGKTFNRTRIGGVTRAISSPHGGDETLLGRGIWKEEVALHFSVGQSAKDGRTSTVGSGIEANRHVLEQGSNGEDRSSVYARAVNGFLPAAVQAYHLDDIAQLILIKRDFPTTNLVIYGGHGAALVVEALADASIPVILTGNRGAPSTWEKKDSLPRPPLTEPPAKVRLDAGISLGLAVSRNSKLHVMTREARWAGKFAGLSDKESIKLVSTNIDTIFGADEKGDGDFVLWEGNPLRGEGAVVVSIRGDGEVSDCWPEID
ncbi:uncharacterized protein BDW70DRAFT_169809 [Aspergillus foveolatus]|uniref:uncharacterized protein n=1 Tax=Aspergillus foveolatus TaxID=210207 RepID=UPI003CCD172E